MGTVDLHLSSMAKILIVLAWAGLVASVPQWSDLVSRSSPRGGVDTGNLVSAVLSGLDIQGAVASALRGRSQTSAGSRGPVGSVTTVRVGEWSAWSPVSGQGTQTVVSRPAPAFTSQANTGFTGNSKFSTSSRVNSGTIVSSVLSALSPDIQRAVANALSSSSSSSSSRFVGQQSSFT